MDVSIWIWVALLGGILAMLAVDLFMHRDSHEIRVKEAAIWSAVWVTIGLAVGGLIWWGYGSEFGLQYFAGYVIEKSLAVDNVFVWAVIFGYFAVPKQYQHRVLFYGVIGALIFRAIFISRARSSSPASPGSSTSSARSSSSPASRCCGSGTSTSTCPSHGRSGCSAGSSRRPTSTTASAS